MCFVRLVAGFILGTCLFAVGALCAQKTALVGSQSRLPEYQLYYLFLKNTAYISKLSNETNNPDKSGKGLRQAFATKLGLTDSDTQALFSFAVDLDKQITEIDDQAREIIQGVRNKHHRGDHVPPPPPQLEVLQQRKTILLKSAVDQLNLVLSHDGATDVQNYLKTPSAIALHP